MTLQVTVRYYKTLQEVLQETKTCATKYEDVSWHYKNDEVIQDAIIG